MAPLACLGNQRYLLARDAFVFIPTLAQPLWDIFSERAVIKRAHSPTRPPPANSATLPIHEAEVVESEPYPGALTRLIDYASTARQHNRRPNFRTATTSRPLSRTRAGG